eukprot:gene13804-15224_t
MMKIQNQSGRFFNLTSTLLWVGVLSMIVYLSKWQPVDEPGVLSANADLPISFPHRSLSGGGGSLFGIMSELDPVKGTLSFVIIVAAVLFVEFLFEGLMYATNDTPFQKLIPYVQKELMVAGCTAFAFKVIVNASDNGMDSHWFEGLEYADLVVPIFSFIYCGFGIFLIIAAGKQCNEWSLAYRHHLYDLFNHFFDYALTWKYSYFWWIPTRITDNVEFRIFHNIFCDTYKIQRQAFAFDEYVDRVYEELVLESIEIRPRDWIVVSLLFTLNLLRLIAGVGFGSSCDSHDHECRDEGMSKLFAVGGALLIFYSLIVALYTRYLKIKIMEKKGVRNIDQYHKYLHHMEFARDKIDNENRKGLDELKAVVDDLKNQKAREVKSVKRFFSFKYWHDLYRNFGKKQIKTVVTIVKNTISRDSGDLSESEKELLDQWKFIAEDVEREIENSKVRSLERRSSLRSFTGSPSQKVAPHVQRENIATDAEKEKKEDIETGVNSNDVTKEGPSNKGVMPSHQLVLSAIGAISHHFAIHASSKKHEESENPIDKDEEEIQKLEDEEIALNFPFGQPEIYFEMIQLLILFLSLYSALWVSNFVEVVPKVYKGISAIPIVISTFFFISMMGTAALLKAVSEFDNDIVLEVIEETENSKILAKMVREKIVIRLRELSGNTHDISEGLTALFKLFKQIDANGNGLLSREEFAEFLHAVDINFSRKKWNQIFRDIDLSHDDLISFNEFFMFVFLHDNRQPDPEEVVRVEHLSKEVQKKRSLFEAMTKNRRQSLYSYTKNGSTIAPESPIGGNRNRNGSFTRIDGNDELLENSLSKAIAKPN